MHSSVLNPILRASAFSLNLRCFLGVMQPTIQPFLHRPTSMTAACAFRLGCLTNKSDLSSYTQITSPLFPMAHFWGPSSSSSTSFPLATFFANTSAFIGMWTTPSSTSPPNPLPPPPKLNNLNLTVQNKTQNSRGGDLWVHVGN